MDIKREVEDAIRALRIAENHFSEATGAYVQIAAYEYTAARAKADAAIARAKREAA